MAEHLAVYELIGSRSISGLGIDPITSRSATASLSASGSLTFGGVVGQRDGLINPPLVFGPGDTSAPASHVFGRVQTDAPAEACIEAVRGQEWWAIDGALVDNGNVNAIRRNQIAPNPRLGGPLMLEFSGAAQAAIAALGGAAVDVDVVFHYAEAPYLSNWAGLYGVIDFENLPPSSIATSFEVRELLALFGSPSARRTLGVDAALGTIYLNDCNYSGIAPDGVLWCRPEDRGNAAGQIPNNVGDNTAAAFRFHPNVFVRRANYFRHVTRQAVEPAPLNVTGQEQPITIGEVGADLVDSDWLIIVDGCAMIVRLPHPAGSDLRRPRDIWNQIWVPLISGSQAPSLGAVFEALDLIQTAASIGTRLKYLEYARMIGLGSVFEVEYTPQDEASPQA